MHRQTAEREERLSSSAPATLDGLPTLETGVVAVVPGAGNRRLFESLRATRVIEGGQTMNPSTADLVAAVEATPATAVIVLPNNANVILSAEQAVSLAGVPARIVPTRSVQAGLVAMVAYDPQRSAADNEEAMLAALEGIATGEVTVASRDVELDGVDVRKGAWLGLADGAAVASGNDFGPVAEAVVERLLEGERELLTLLTGADEPPLAALVALSGSGTRTSRSRSTPGASRTIPYSCRRNRRGRRDQGSARRGQRGLPLDAGAAARRS